MKIPTKAITLCLPRDPVAGSNGSSVAPPPASPGRRSHATETESGREESGQRPRAGYVAGARETVTAATRNPTRPKRRQAVEKAGEVRRRRSEERREAEEENTLGELGMAAAAPDVLPRVGRASRLRAAPGWD